ncbi:MAG: T9SS type A sorting domain-containing protein [Chitinophagales bacterium]|jgi:hypothetical protein|nr:T9SS type A sorting domain-containing protein [Bacteroidota bacterium]MBP9220502.1 T9SS type A sorting domain-containing protein [Chitinophagales bacterium]MBP9796284.1 T9SS type A sorting domain-containing protein [Chitinophagales bacterium]
MGKIQFTLKEYSILSVTFLLLNNNSTAQIIYTDIDPDMILDTYEEEGFVDMDNNGLIDFSFQRGNTQYVTTTYSGELGETFTRTVIWASFPDSPENEIAGSYNTFSSSFTRYYPYAINLGDIITKVGPDGLSFQDWPFQRMAYKLKFNSGILIGSGGNWFPEKIDRYLGVHFVDSDDNYHYGWIRCSVIDSGDVLIIKDYAYEMEVDKPIYAGDTINFNGIEEIYLPGITIYSFESDIYIIADDKYINSKEVKTASVKILDLSGDLIYETTLNEKNTKITFDELPPSLYLVEVTLGNDKMVKKVILQ